MFDDSVDLEHHPICFLGDPEAAKLSALLSIIGTMSPARLSLSMVASPQSPPPFHLAKAF